MQNKKQKRIRRHAKIRSNISGTKERPRLSVFKSNTGVYAQIIDDSSNSTLLSISTKDVKGKNMVERSKEAGKELAKKALDKKVNEVVFDRGGFIYTGKIKALAEGAREAGLKF